MSQNNINPDPMRVDKDNRLTIAKESLEVAIKMVSRYEYGNVPASEMSRIADAAVQATQAAQQLNQLIGLLQYELSASSVD